MKKIEITEEVQHDILKISNRGLLDMISNGDIIWILQNYEIDESFILENKEYFDKKIIIQVIGLSQNFIEKSIESKYFEENDIKNFNMKTYSNLGNEFIEKYNDYIDWERMMLYLMSSDKIVDFDKYKDIIDKLNLWQMVSANDLPIEFIRENKNKLEWNILSIIKKFSDEELNEFSEFLPEKKTETITFMSYE